MKIVINPLDGKSISNALKQIKEYEKYFELKEQEFVKRLAEIGVQVARVGFSLADYDGNNDVTVTMNQQGTQATIVASGNAVGFIEFGTGVRYPEWSGSSETGYKPPAHGTYGKGQGKNPKGWWYGHHQHTYGNMPAEAMLTARNEVIEKITSVAREVFND